jgi:hypothetical protein
MVVMFGTRKNPPQGDYSALELRKAGFSAKELKQGLRKVEN